MAETTYYAKRVAVTGGAGFVASHLVDALVTSGAKVVAIDNLLDGKLSNLRQSKDAIQFCEVDIRNAGAIQQAIDGSDYVFHLAGNATVPRSISDPAYDFEANVLGTYHILQSLLAGRVGRVLFSSTAAVYGVPIYTPMDERHPLEPISPYGGSKLAAERLGIAYARALDANFVVARIFNTFGPRQRKYVMFDLLNKLHANPLHLEVLGDGSQLRDYSYVGDTVRALMTIMESGRTGEAYNIAGGNPTYIRDLVTVLASVMNLNGQIEVTYTGQSWKGDIPAMVADISKLQSLGFTPCKPFTDGVRDLRTWMEKELWA